MKLISVIMSVYNTEEKYLRTAIESILNQTYQYFEFLIIDDCSESACSKVLYSYTDPRIRIIRNETNLGLTKSLNILLDQARGDYIARMDADDICFPERLEKQLAYMERHTDIDVLATSTVIYEKGRPIVFSDIYREYDQERNRVRLSLANISFPHPTVMFRSAFLNDWNLRYDETIRKAQDYNMWVRCAQHGNLFVLQEPLMILRVHENQISANAADQQRCAAYTKLYCFTQIYPQYTKRQAELYIHMRDTDMYGEATENIELIRILVSQNERKKIYDHTKYCEELFFWWLRKSMYRKNRKYRNIILKNPYMKKNIRRVFIKGMFRYIADKLNDAYFKLYWGSRTKPLLKELIAGR